MGSAGVGLWASNEATRCYKLHIHKFKMLSEHSSFACFGINQEIADLGQHLTIISNVD